MKHTILALILAFLMSACTKSAPPPPPPPPLPPSQAPEAELKKTYIGHSPDECARIRFVCPEGEEYFADNKGCGCVEKGSEPDNTP